MEFRALRGDGWSETGPERQRRGRNSKKMNWRKFTRVESRSLAYFFEDGRVWKCRTKEWYVITSRDWNLKKNVEYKYMSVIEQEWKMKVSKEDKKNPPCRGHCWNMGWPPAPQHKHGGSWRRSCRERRECFPLGIWWQRYHSLCVSFSVAANKWWIVIMQFDCWQWQQRNVSDGQFTTITITNFFCSAPCWPWFYVFYSCNLKAVTTADNFFWKKKKHQPIFVSIS